jgi:phenylalanyl-tRNA synthetase alpha chain
MIEKIEELLVEVNAFQSQNKDEIEQFRIKFNSKKGILNDLFDKFKEVPNEQKRDFGQKINTLKQAVNTKLEELKDATSSNIIIEKEDLTKPAFPLELGSRHPINLVRSRIIEIFKSIGFAVADDQKLKMIGTILQRLIYQNIILQEICKILSL